MSVTPSHQCDCLNSQEGITERTRSGEAQRTRIIGVLKILNRMILRDWWKWPKCNWAELTDMSTSRGSRGASTKRVEARRWTFGMAVCRLWISGFLIAALPRAYSQLTWTPIYISEASEFSLNLYLYKVLRPTRSRVTGLIFSLVDVRLFYHTLCETIMK